MTFTYTYRSSDGQRRTAEIEAENRDAAFAKLRTELGIKPIKVTLAGNRDTRDAKRRAPVLGVLGVLGVLAVLGLGVWRWLAARPEAAPYQVMTPQGPVTLSVATPLARQRIPGDRARIEAATAVPMRRQDGGVPSQGVFQHAAERWLARYAEPGRQVNGAERPAPADFEAALREPIRIASTDYTEWVDLKRIVTGMKREMVAYLAAGGTTEGYLGELEKRQKLEISYRERAERRLAEMLAGARDARPYQGGASSAGAPSPEGRSATGQDRLRDAYAYWLKANAQLKSMGIWEMPLPDALRAYQMGLDIDE